MPLRTLRLLLVLMAGVLLCRVALAQPARPAEAAPQPKQDYEELPVDETLKKNYNAINPILMAGRFAPGQQADFDDYYRKYFLARWTDAKNITTLPAFRKELRNSHLGKRSAAPDVHAHLNALVLEFMNKLATGPYHPAVQVNAMLMIGELNSVEQPPTPLPEALDAMIAAVQDTKLSDAVRAAAMVGIQRHAAANISDAEVRRTLTAALLKLAANDLPAGADKAGREWILAQALETLGTLGSVGEGNAVFKMMIKTVADAKLSFSTRSIAAESLGRLNYAGAAGINPVESAAVLGQFLIDACAEELRLAKVTGKGVSRRRMQQCLSAVLTALIGGEEGNRKGIASLPPAPGQQTFLGDLQKSVEKMSEQIAKWREGDDLEGQVDELQGNLEAWLQKKPK